MKQQTQLLPSRRWTVLLTSEQQKTYASAIRQGYFAAYDGYRWRHTFYGAFIWKHPGRIRPLNIFREIIGRPPMWSDITDDNLRDFKAALDAAYAPNSVRTICAEVNAIIRDYAQSRNIPSMSYARILKAKKLMSQAVYLTEGEIVRIHQYAPRTAKRRYIKRLFMLECLCGARLSDCMRLSTDNLSTDGRTVTYVAQKTNREVTVPVHPWLRQYLVPSSPTEPRSVAVSSYNEGIRFFCRACGINTKVKVFQAGHEQNGPKWQFVSSHTGRRSFATNLSLKNVPLEQIALMMGHFTGNAPDIAMTQHYIVTRLKLSPAAFQAFTLPGAERLAAEQLAADTPSPLYDDPALDAAFCSLPPDGTPAVIPERPQLAAYSTDRPEKAYFINNNTFSPTAARTSGNMMTNTANNAPQTVADLDYKYHVQADTIVTKASHGGFASYTDLFAAVTEAQADYAEQFDTITDCTCEHGDHDDLFLILTSAQKSQAAGTPVAQWAEQFIQNEWLGK